MKSLNLQTFKKSIYYTVIKEVIGNQMGTFNVNLPVLIYSRVKFWGGMKE